MKNLLDTVFKSLGIFVMLCLIVFSMVLFKACENTLEQMDSVRVENDNSN